MHCLYANAVVQPSVQHCPCYMAWKTKVHTWCIHYHICINAPMWREKKKMVARAFWPSLVGSWHAYTGVFVCQRTPLTVFKRYCQEILRCLAKCKSDDGGHDRRTPREWHFSHPCTPWSTLYSVQALIDAVERRVETKQSTSSSKVSLHISLTVWGVMSYLVGFRNFHFILHSSWLY